MGLTPIWLTAPTRFAKLRCNRARWVLALIAALLVASLTALAAPGPAAVSGDPAARADDQADIVLYEGIVEGVRHGGNYYAVAAQALRAGDYPLKPFVTFRLPTLAELQGSLPQPAVIALLYALALAVMLAWAQRLAPAFSRRPPLIIALVLLAGGMMAHVQADLAAFHEVWAGLLIALSVALRRPGRWMEAVAFGLAAMLIRETAALYVAVMAVLAFLDRDRREALAWSSTIALLAVVVVLHARAVAEVVQPLDPASPGWAGMLGFGFFTMTISISTALSLAWPWLAALLVGLSLAGWAAWRDPLGVRVFATLAAYALLLSLFGRPDTFYWGLLVAPASLVGLAFVPDAARDLYASLVDKRRITVTRRTT